jgi:nucleoside 2-deoxyribosyltransferase
MSERSPYTVYFAGPLFDHKDLAGNALLGSQIDEQSGGRYRCILPQDLEQRGIGPMGIRDQDLKAVMECDLAIFNFDGTELDSGTVVEYVYAKMLDIPAVILRTDFRHGGDQRPEMDPWNLMVSFFPRTRIGHLDGMSWYQQSLDEGGDAVEVSARYYRRIAGEVVRLLDDVCGDAPVLEGGPAGAERAYRWAVHLAGGGLSGLVSGDGSLDEAVRRIVSRKSARGLLC